MPRVSRDQLPKTDDEWREKLTPEQFQVARKAGTERAFTGEYWDCHDDGTYECVCCGAPLFSSDTKFESGTGWPSFFQALDPEAVEEDTDTSHGMVRTEGRAATAAPTSGTSSPTAPAHRPALLHEQRSLRLERARTGSPIRPGPSEVAWSATDVQERPARSPSDNRLVTALTVGITTALPACKRGLAVNLAASLARTREGAGVCRRRRPAHARRHDPARGARAVPRGLRRAAAPDAALGSVHEPPLWVVPSAGAGIGLTHPGGGEGAAAAACRLRRRDLRSPRRARGPAGS